MQLRDYQQRGIDQIRHEFANGARSVLAVAPTGSGKGVCIAAIANAAAQRGSHVLVIVHRRDIILDLANRIQSHGVKHVGVILPNHDANPYASVQVASTQTLLARDALRPKADLIIPDESHHYSNNNEWSSVLKAYPDARILGFTATPERADGRPLGDMFDRLVVVATYSELIAAGHIVPCNVFQPPSALGRDLAQDPVEAYRRYADGTKAFAFAASVDAAKELADRFTAAGIPAVAVNGKTNRRDRDAALADLRAGRIRVLVNVYVFTEGTDVPSVETIILARNCDHVSTYLQIVGRGLRPAPGKTAATLIDLTGASLTHGLPTEDREYSLDGNGIRRAANLPSLSACGMCGLVPAQRPCARCGYAPEPPKPPRIWDVELRAVWAGAATPDEAKLREWDRLRKVAADREYSLDWAVKQYRSLFENEAPPLATLSDDEKRAAFDRWAAFGAEKGFKPGYALVRYREAFGVWPKKEWRRDAVQSTPSSGSVSNDRWPAASGTG